MRRILHISAILLLFLASCLVSMMAEEHYIYSSTRVSTFDGLSSNIVRCMLQDQQGYLWFGTSNGLSRYDGYHFVNFAPGDDGCTLIDSHINELREDTARGLLWMVSSNFSTACYDLRSNAFVPYERPEAANDHYSQLYVSPHHVVLYDEGRGMRVLRVEEGLLKVTDYNTVNGQLPHDRVQPVQEDAQHQLWIPTLDGLALLTVDGRLTTIDSAQGYEAVTSVGEKVFALAVDHSVAVFDTHGRLLHRINSPQPKTGTVWYHALWDGLWLLMVPDGILTFNVQTERFEPTPPSLALKQAYPVYQDTATLWLAAADNQLHLLARHSREAVALPLLSQKSIDQGIRPRYRLVRGFREHSYYIAVYGEGLYAYDVLTGDTRHHTAEDERPLIHSDYILGLLADRSHSLWASCDFIGLSKITRPNIVSRIIFPDSKQRKDRTNFVRKLYRHADGTITVSCRDGSLYRYNPKQDHMLLQGTVRTSAYEYFEDSRGHTWIGTRGDGLLLDGKKVEQCPASNIYSMVEDRHGRIWMATLGDRLLMLQPETMEFAQYLTQNRNQRRQHTLCMDRDERLWVGTDDGLYIVDTRKKQVTDDDFMNFSKQRGNFCQTEIICLKADSEGRVWSGANNGGAVRCQLAADGTMDYFQPTDRQGLQRRNVSTIETDRQQNVWIGTDDGLALWNAETGIVRWFFFGEDVQSNVYSENSSVLTPDGDVLFGTNYGLLRLSPQTGSFEPHDTVPLITAVSINGKEQLDLSRKLSLAHDENRVSISFSDMDYSQSSLAVFTYYLEGREKPWVNTTAGTVAHYDHLPPGRYTFHVKMLTDNEQEVREQTLSFVINQPWWNTWWAWLLYLLAAAAIVGLFLRQFLHTLRLRENLRIEKNVTEFRLNFFTQVSHEFRTPLSIIENSVDQLENEPTSAAGKQWLQSLRRGTSRLLKLVNQLLEFRRLNLGEGKLSVSEGDIVEAVKNVYMDLWNMADRKSLAYTFTPFAKSYSTMFDHQALETIVYNLLSNAVKYTPEKGSVALTLRQDNPEQLTIVVENSGTPLTEQQRHLLFQPYMHGYVSKGGMGIGLYVAHELALLHHGSLFYDEQSLDGVRFCLTLPARPDSYSEDERASVSALKPETPTSETVERETLSKMLTPLNDRMVLIIEDDADMAEQLELEIGSYFRVETCSDGKMGFQHACELNPDVVVCDVMLPSMDGYEITQQLKAQEATSRLPIILLTAFTDDQHHVKGIEAGADAFLTKPCNARVLLSLIMKLMTQRKQDGQKRDDTMHGSPTIQETVEQLIENIKQEPGTFEVIITDMGDKKFRERLQDTVAHRLHDKNFNVDELMQTMNMGRTQFYKKCKEVMGMSPNEYIRNARMLKAVQLLQEGEMNVNQVSYAVGIDNPSYFIRCFKAKYGMKPSQYKKI